MHKPMLPYVIPALRWIGHPNSIPMQDRYYKLGEITYEDVCAWREEVKREGEEVDEIMTLSRTAGLGKLIRKRFVIGCYALFIENQEFLFRKAQKVRRLIVEDITKALSLCDGLIAPASNQGALKINDTKTDQLSSEYLIAENFMALANFSGYPSMTLPFGYDELNLPVGINITCTKEAETMMFNLALGIEECTKLKDQIKEVQE
ncbi:MAG: amidase family protein [Erysipelotrichaceae bacterium]